MSGFVQRLPNILTVLRLAAIPFFVFLMMNPSPIERWVAAVLFALAGCTDILDGMIARRYGATSDIGKLLDPLADKLLVVAGLVMLVAQRSELTGEPWVPAWLVVLLIGRELWVTGLRGILASRGVVLAARESGKLKSLFQIVAIVALLLSDVAIPLGDFLLTGQFLGLNLLIIAAALALWSAGEYTADHLEHILGEPKSENG